MIIITIDGNINKRQEVWQQIHGWIAGVPKRNLLVALGDFNASLAPQHPHIGQGVGHVHVHKKDGHALQSLIQTAGLNAVNTWQKGGQQASTFWTHKGEGSQIDYILVRNLCSLSQLRPGTLPHAPIVHPTGFRHVPVQCQLRWPKPPHTTPTSQVTAQHVRRVCAQLPQVMDQFKEKIQPLQCSAEQLDVKLQEVWQKCSPAKPILPIQPDNNAIC